MSAVRDAIRERLATDPRFTSRRRAVEDQRRRKLAIAAGSVTVVVALVWVTFFSPLLAVRNVEVKGARHTSEVEVMEATGMPSGENLLRVSTMELSRRAERLPWVRDARVRRNLPNTVTFSLTERRAAMLLTIGAASWTIDARGRVLEVGAARKGLPALGGMELDDIAVGASVSSPEVRAGLAVWRSLSGGLRRDVEAIFAPTRSRVSLSLRAGTVVRYGSPSQLAAKDAVLRAVVADLRRDGTVPSYIDVTVPTSPAVGPPVDAPAG